MALSTYQKFQYGWEITTANRYIDFNDGADKSFMLSVGKYSPTKLAQELASKFNANSSLDFTVTYDSVTRTFAISASANFELLFLTGTNNAETACAVFGFDKLDLSGDDSYVSDFASGAEYSPQFKIQSYMPTSNNRRAIDGIINKSASGVIEFIKYGNERFMSGEILFITNTHQRANSIIRNSKTAVEDYISFIEWCTDKGPVKFFEDEDLEISEDFILESTEKDQKGLDYELIELYDRGWPECFRSGKLTFRLVE